MTTAILYPIVLGGGLTQAEVLSQTEKAYASAKTLSVEAKLTSKQYSATAKIQWVAPNNLRVAGKSGFNSDYVLLVAKGKTSVFNAGNWETVGSPDTGIASVTGISGTLGNVVPSFLLKPKFGGYAVANGNAIAPVEKVNGKPAYKLSNQFQEIWVDQKTFFVVQTKINAGTQPMVGVYGRTVVNAPIPASVFKK